MNRRISTLNGSLTLIAVALVAVFLIHQSNSELAAVSDSQPEVAQVVSSLSNGLLGYWTFDDGTGIGALDSSGNGHTGTLIGTTLPTWTTAGNVGTHALVFDGVSSKVNVSDNGALQPTSGISIAAWIYPTKSVQFQEQFLVSDALSGGSSGGGWRLGVEFNSVGGTGSLIFGPLTAATAFSSLNKWYEIVATSDSSGYKLYVNGVQVATSATPWSITPQAPSTMSIGAASFGGTIDDLRVYNRAITSIEVTSLYNQGNTVINYVPPPPPLSSVTAASCNAVDIKAAIAGGIASGGTVNVPAGNCTWTTSTGLNITTPITLKGAGQGVTTITIGPSAQYAGVLGINAPNVTVTGFTFMDTLNQPTYAIAVGGASPNFRITNNTFNTSLAGGQGAYLAIGGSYGLIDNNSILNGAPGGELIFARGPANSWETPDSFGTSDNLIIENNTITFVTNTAGELIDCNADCRAVLRYNDITNGYFDAHGRWSDSPATGVREYEIYDNYYTTNPNVQGAQQNFFNLRGGTGRVFNNEFVSNFKAGNYNVPSILLHEFCMDANNGNCYPTTATPRYVCPSDYPVLGQIGRGEYVNGVQSSDPLYMWNNTVNGVAPGFNYGEGNEPDAAAKAQCGDPSYTFSSIIQLNRDYFVSATEPAAMTSTYVPYTCPDPATGLGGGCNANVPGRAGYDVGAPNPPVVPPVIPPVVPPVVPPAPVAPVISAVLSSGVTYNSATITWTTDEAASSQVSYGLTTAYGNTTALNASLLTSHSVSLSGLLPNTVYHYEVISKDSNGLITASADQIFATPAAPDVTPPVLSGITVSNIAQTVATINWTTDELSDTQAKYGLTTSYTNTTALTSTLSTSHFEALSGLTANTLYHYEVLSKDASGNLATSPDHTFITAAVVIPPVNPPATDTTAPTVPTGIVATPLSSSQINLTWGASSDNVGVAGYHVFRNGALWSTVVTPSFSDFGLLPSTTYTYTFSAFDAAGNESARSSTVIATTLTPPPTLDTIAPSVPTGLVANTLSSTEIDLSWNASTDNIGVIGYHIYRNGNLWSTVAISEFSDFGLMPSLTYSYTVAAFDAAGNMSAQSTSAIASTLPAPTTVAPPPVTQPVIPPVNNAPPASSTTGSLTLTVEGNNPATIQVGSLYNDPGVLVNDPNDDFVPVTATVNGQSVGLASTIDLSTRIPLVYTIVYTATDDAGNTATISRVVRVISLSSLNPQPTTTTTIGQPQQSVTETLYLGITNPQVNTLQQLLNQNGYPVAASGQGSLGQESTYFGNATQAALEKFQCAKIGLCSGDFFSNGYGSTNPATRAALATLSYNPSFNGQTTTTTTTGGSSGTTGSSSGSTSGSAPSQPSSTFSGAFTTPLKLGDNNAEVRALQVFLNNHHFTVATSGPGSPGNESTYFGPATAKALINFQNTNAALILTPSGLTQGTGYFGPATMKVVNEEN